MGQTALIDTAMRQVNHGSTDALVVAAAVLRLLVERASGGRVVVACGDVATWRAIAATVDRSAWFQAAGPEARVNYDAVMDRIGEKHQRTGQRPTMSDVLDALTALPAPVVVAGTVDFTIGFLDNAATADLVTRFVRVVFNAAAERPASQVERQD